MIVFIVVIVFYFLFGVIRLVVLFFFGVVGVGRRVIFISFRIGNRFVLFVLLKVDVKRSFFDSSCAGVTWEIEFFY